MKTNNFGSTKSCKTLLWVLITACFPFAASAQLKYPVLRLPIGHNKSISSINISPDGKFIATGGEDKLVILWDAQTGKVINWIATENDVSRIFFTQDSKYIISVEGSITRPFDDKVINLWDIKTSRKIKSFSFNTDNNIAVSHRSNYIMVSPLLTAKNDKIPEEPEIDNDNDEEADKKVNAHVYDIFGETKISDLAIGMNFDVKTMSLANPVFCFMAYQNSDLVISARTNAESSGPENRYLIELWQLKDMSKPMKIFPSRQMITAVCGSDRGDYFAAVAGNQVQVWDINSGHLKSTFISSGSEIINTGFSSNGSRLFCHSLSNTSNTIQEWQIEEHKEIFKKTITLSVNGDNPVNDEDGPEAGKVAFFPDGKHIVIAEGNQARIFNENGIDEYELKGILLNTKSLFFSSDNHFLISAPDSEEDRQKHVQMVKKFIAGTSLHLGKREMGMLDNKLKMLDEYVKKPTLISKWDLEEGKNLWSDTGTVRTGDSISNDKNLVIINQENSNNASRSSELITIVEKMNGGNGNGIQDIVEMTNRRFGETSKEKLLINKKIHDTLRLITLDSANWIIINKDGYYKCSRDAAGLLHYVTNDDKVVSFEQLDLRFNRPDTILRSLGSKNEDLIDALKKTYEMRLARYKIKPGSAELDIPLANFSRTDDLTYIQNKQEIKLTIHAQAQNAPLMILQAWVNEVPVFGKSGISISNASQNTLDTTITVSLSEGNNKIETSVLNAKGFESYRFPLYLSYKPAVPQKKRTWFIGLAVNKYADPRKNKLKFTIDDVREIARQLKKRAKDEFIVDTLFNADFTPENFNLIKQKLATSGIEDRIIIAYSGHGCLNNGKFFMPTSLMDAKDFSNPGTKAVSYEELEELLFSIPARKKLVLLDACLSGNFDSLRMSVAGGSTTQIMDEVFTYAGRGTGANIIASSSGTESSFEPTNSSMKHGFFTQGILNAIEHNDFLTARDLQKYILKEVPKLSGGKQKPSVRSENHQLSFLLW